MVLRKIRDIDKEQSKDPKIEKIRELIQNGKKLKGYEISKDVLKKDGKIVLTLELTKELIKEVYLAYGHIGSVKCIRTINEAFYFPKIREIACQITKCCDSCQRNKNYTGNTFATSRPITPTKPGELLAIDFLGPYPEGRGMVKHALVMCDTFTKLVAIYPIRRATTQITIKKLFEEYIPKNGPVEKVQTDHGTQFTSPKWVSKLQQEQIQPIFSSIRHPKSNIVERYNKEIVRFLRTLLKDRHGGWAQWIPFIEECLNTTYNETTGYTPMELHFNKTPRRIWEALVGEIPKENTGHAKKIFIVAKRIRTKGEKRAAKINEGKTCVRYKIGQNVLIKAEHQSDASKAMIAKFLELYEGPYTVTRILHEHTYEVTDTDTNNTRGKFHTSLIRPYFQDGPTTTNPSNP